MTADWRLQAARELRRARQTRDVTVAEWVEEYNDLHGTSYTRGFGCKLLYDLRDHEATVQSLDLPAPMLVRRVSDDDTDMAQWVEQRDALLSSRSTVRVMHLNDIHFPYHDVQALRLALQIVERVQPDVIVVGSDAFDYPDLSRFPADPDLQTPEDWLMMTRRTWRQFIPRLRQAAPDALLPFIFGNHDRRGLQAIMATSAPRVMMGVFVDAIRASGEVFYLGKTEVVEIGSFVVTHGNKASLYAARHIAKQWAGREVNTGHTHRPQRIMKGLTNGCLCQLVPHYHDDGYPVDWRQGTSVATIDTASGEVLQVPYEFRRSGDTLWTDVGGEILRVTDVMTPNFREDAA